MLAPHAACLSVAAIVAACWLPVIWRSTLFNWHIQTGYSQAQLCDWPAWQEGFSTICTHGEWFYRTLERRAIKLPSTLWTSGAAHALQSGPLFYGGIWAAHVASSVLVCAIARRMTDRALLSVLAGLVFGLHPAAAEVMVTGQFTQYVLGGFASLLALWLALRGASVLAIAAVLLLACLSDVTFLVTPIIVLLWVDDRRRLWPACAWVLVLAGLIHGVHGVLHPSLRHHHAELPPVPLDERLLRALVVEPVLAVRRLLLAWSPSSGPWFMDAPTSELEGLGPLEPVSLAWLAGLVVGMAWLARRDFAAVVRLAVLPIALLLIDLGIKAGWSDVLTSRWSGLRQVYVPAALLALTAAWCMRRTSHPRVLATAGALLLSWSAFLSWSLAERTWTRMDADQHAFLAAAAELEPLAIPPGTTAYLFEVGDARPFSSWQGTLRDHLGDARFTVITHAPSSTEPTRFVRTGPRTLELELCAACAAFLRRDQQPSWAGPLDPSQRFVQYLRRGGQLNLRPIFDAGTLDGRRVPLPGIDGADVRVLSIEPGRPVRLELRTRDPLDDPRTVLLVERPSGWMRVACPERGACSLAPP
jgi:hypothetical protein